MQGIIPAASDKNKAKRQGNCSYPKREMVVEGTAMWYVTALRADAAGVSVDVGQ